MKNEPFGPSYSTNVIFVKTELFSNYRNMWLLASLSLNKEIIMKIIMKIQNSPFFAKWKKMVFYMLHEKKNCSYLKMNDTITVIK